MSTSKTPPLPAILIANDLLTGDVVFWHAGGWSRDPRAAALAEDAAAAATLEEAGRAAMRANHVVDAYLVDIDLSATGVPVPRHFRERFRLLGPTTRPDLGKQAEFPALATPNAAAR